MSSDWAEEAERQAKAMTRDLVEVGRTKGFRVTYQRREARFMLRAGTVTTYFSAHDYDGPRGMDWLRLRIDVLMHARPGQAEGHVEPAGLGPAPH
ncbi:hypothetical protein D7X55_10245 [Corallococcus sp. AB049A]|nr:MULTISPECIES: hypothetical protein [Corallococcus]RKI70308.1 hypothetical protein D7X55_10245 [Corallococcus sp. AB049A]